MEAAEAVAKVEQWLSAVQGAREPRLRVEREKVRRVPEGWSVPYNSVAFLDGGDAGKQIFPPPRLVVREPDGALREPSPRPGGVSIPARTPGQGYWEELIDPEFTASGLGHLGVPELAIGGWRWVGPDGTRGAERENPRYRSGPLRIGYGRPVNELEWMLLFADVDWFDRERLLTGLTQVEVLVPHHGQRVGPDTPSLEVYSSTGWLDPMTTAWRRVDLATLVAELPQQLTLRFYGPGQHYPFLVSDVVAALRKFPRVRPPVDVLESRFEISPEVARLVEETAAELGLPSPVEPPTHAALYARINGFELTDDEIRRTVIGKSWRKLVSETEDPSRWPTDLAANGLQPAYGDDGRIEPIVDRCGKYCSDAPQGYRHGFRRISGAYVGFALGEALAISGGDGPLRIGPLTQRLLFLTEGVIRGRSDLAAGATGGLLRWLHTQGDTVPGEVDGWLVQVPDLYADSLPDPDELAAIRELAMGRPGTGSGSAALLAALPAAVTTGVPAVEHNAGATARLIAGVTHQPGVDLDAAEYLAEVFDRMLTKLRLPPTVWVAGTEPGLKDLGVRDALPDYARFGLPEVLDPKDFGSGHDSLTVLRHAFSAIAGYENQPEVALRRAVGHSGRTALTGALAGALIGSRNGIPGLPWVERLELRYLVENVATDAYRHFNRSSPLNMGYWTERYPTS
ncbi:YrhB domain-containing protein [Saccharothrix coeruleofusca]|uniref:ADP-ribosylglycohydrolase n=1 Tax=Saccharothrix coeruleofusca TaxID=33919 RepID=A0A918EG30_9PSEU|nr:YrhB domain-containing protein [Saccharothrix coeruleofusca]GGP65460.1 ADP-ribosylglycohydrolase [Saccharothrix coeruleofusca]